MRIKSIYIPDFLILKDFRLEFISNRDFAIIIGDNGSGKSTLLEVIAYIFGTCINILF
ncbi:AAA family ATPase [Cruoricaptor ignavus]|uniref:AAA family ATPase n=1 Tax=Cruoricaptor ignavus TaxID=1118202 RepID=UPI00370D05E3